MKGPNKLDCLSLQAYLAKCKLQPYDIELLISYEGINKLECLSLQAYLAL
jgi:hypothetical protein